MFNIFDQHWTLLIVAALVYRIMDVFLSDDNGRWQWYCLTALIVISYTLNILAGTQLLSLTFTVRWILQVIFGVSIAALFVARPARAAVARKKRWSLWLLPAALAVTAFACDGLVKTDAEAITDLCRKALRAAEHQDPDAIDAILADDYADSYHKNKDHLMRYCRRLFSQPLVEKCRQAAFSLELSPPTARLTLTVLTVFKEQSFVRKQYFIPAMHIKVRLDLQKTTAERWLIKSAELLEIDRRPVNWHNVR